MWFWLQIIWIYKNSYIKYSLPLALYSIAMNLIRYCWVDSKYSCKSNCKWNMMFFLISFHNCIQRIKPRKVLSFDFAVPLLGINILILSSNVNMLLVPLNLISSGLESKDYISLLLQKTIDLQHHSSFGKQTLLGLKLQGLGFVDVTSVV